MSSHPPGFLLVERIWPKWRRNSVTVYQTIVLISTYLAYTAYHMSRKPISIVKNSESFLDCSANGSSCSSWISQLDGESSSSAKLYLGLLDTTYLFSYAFFMFASGLVAERSDLRVFLSVGMVMSGLCTFLFGFAFTSGVRSLWYFLVVQVLCGLFQSTGWPGVVTVVANWFGEGRRGFMFGVWNSHTSIGNILGSLVAGAFVLDNWGLSFIVPGLVIGVTGFLVLLFLPPTPDSVGLGSPSSPARSVQEPDCVKISFSESSPLLNDTKIDPFNDSSSSCNKEKVDSTGEASAISFLGALKIPGVVEFALCLFCCKLVSYTFLYWLPKYIHSTANLNAQSSAVLSTLFDLGSVVGGVLAGLLADYSGNNACTCAFMLLLAIPSMLVYQHTTSSWCPMAQLHGSPTYDTCFSLNVALLVVTGLLVNGPYNLITTAVSAQLGTHKSLLGSSKALATVTAIIDGTGSLGAATGPLLAAALTQGKDWANVFTMMISSSLAAILLLSRLITRELKQPSNLQQLD